MTSEPFDPNRVGDLIDMVLDRSPAGPRPTAEIPPVTPAGWSPGPGWRAAAADDLPAGAGDPACPVRINGQFPAHLVQHHVMVPPTKILQIGQAGPPAVLAVHHVVRLTSGRGLVTAAGELAPLVPQRHQPPQVGRYLVGLPDVQRERGPVQALAQQVRGAGTRRPRRALRRYAGQWPGSGAPAWPAPAPPGRRRPG